MEPEPRNHRETYAYLCSMLEGLPTASGQDEARRNDSAMEAVAALHPDDAFEAKLAANIVAMQLHAADALRCAARAVDDPAEQRRCRTQATAMARQADSSLRILQRRQAERDKQLAARHPAAMGRAGYWFAEISQPEPAAPEPDPQPSEPAPRAFEQMTEVEQYAALYPRRASAIRAAGGMPADASFPSPGMTIEHGLVHDTSPVLLALDKEIATASRESAQ